MLRLNNHSRTDSCINNEIHLSLGSLPPTSSLSLTHSLSLSLAHSLVIHSLTKSSCSLHYIVITKLPVYFQAFIFICNFVQTVASWGLQKLRVNSLRHTTTHSTLTTLTAHGPSQGTLNRLNSGSILQRLIWRRVLTVQRTMWR